MASGLRWKFSVMMFLEIFIWGAWLPLAYGYLANGLGFVNWQISLVFNAFAIASIAAMFFGNQFADRNFAAEKFLAFSHLVGGVAIFAAAFVTSFWAFFTLFLIHCLFYVPTISITNSIAFTNLPDARDFGKVRLWGTIGWIAASLPFVFILLDWDKVTVSAEKGSMLEAVFDPANGYRANPPLDVKLEPGVDPVRVVAAAAEERGQYLRRASLTYVVAGIASLLLAAFSLLLPHTPPRPATSEEKRFAWLESVKLLNKPFLFVLFIATFIDAMVHHGYFLLADSYLKDVIGIPGAFIMPVMSIGQIAEIGTMAVLGLVLKSLGWRTTMIIGILGHTARFGVFALWPEVLPAVLINVLHGICYAFFFATVYIFVDEFLPKDARTSAQGLFNLLMLGLGPLAANTLVPLVRGYYTGDDKVVDYRSIFLIMSGTALAAALLMAAFFHPPAKAEETHPI